MEKNDMNKQNEIRILYIGDRIDEFDAELFFDIHNINIELLSTAKGITKSELNGYDIIVSEEDIEDKINQIQTKTLVFIPQEEKQIGIQKTSNNNIGTNVIAKTIFVDSNPNIIVETKQNYNVLNKNGMSVIESMILGSVNLYVEIMKRYGLNIDVQKLILSSFEECEKECNKQISKIDYFNTKTEELVSRYDRLISNLDTFMQCKKENKIEKHPEGLRIRYDSDGDIRVKNAPCNKKGKTYSFCFCKPNESSDERELYSTDKNDEESFEHWVLMKNIGTNLDLGEKMGIKDKDALFAYNTICDIMERVVSKIEEKPNIENSKKKQIVL